MIRVDVTTRLSLDAHDLAVQTFGDAAGDPLAIESQDVFKMPGR